MRRDREGPEFEPSHLDRSFVHRVISEGQPADRADLSASPEALSPSAQGEHQFRAVVASPMRIEAHAVGAVAIYSTLRCEWTEAQRSLVNWLAARCGQIIESIRLRERLIRQSALIDLSPDAIIVRKLDGTIKFWSRGAETLYGWTKQQAVGHTTHDLLQTSFSLPLEQIVERLKSKGQWSGELVHRTRDGQEVVIQSRWLGRFDERGQVSELLETNVDVTERKRAETRILRQADVLNGINRIFRDALLSQTEEDLARTCLSIAEAVTASRFGFLGEINVVTGLLDCIAISDPGWDSCRVSPGDRPRSPLGFELQGIYGQVIKEGRGYFTNDPSSHPGGIGFPPGHPAVTAFLGVPLVREGRTIGMVAVGNRDGGYGQEELEALEAMAPAMVEAFSRNRAESALHRLNQELDERVRLRTAELEEANKALESFSYSVSHDLRAPLRSMDGFSQALTEAYEGLLDDRGRDWLSRIRSASQRMGQLIDDLLRLSRLSRAEMRLCRVDLSEMAREIADDLRNTTPGREADFHIAEELCSVGDPDLLRPVLRNLLENAWKFTSRCPSAVIELDRIPGEEPVYFVRDNGAGFDMAYANKLFGPFQRLHSPRDYPGTGIGLALVQRVVHRHGGRIWAEAAPGRGATFYFTLRK